MVVYEAARAMVNLKNVTLREVQPAVSGEQTRRVGEREGVCGMEREGRRAGGGVEERRGKLTNVLSTQCSKCSSPLPNQPSASLP